MTWQPQQKYLIQLLNLLEDASNPKFSEQKLAIQRLLIYNDIPDYYIYFMYILTKMKNKAIEVRRYAGSQLKHGIKCNFNTIPIPILNYIKQCCMDSIIMPEIEVSKTIAAIITEIMRYGQVFNWMEIITLLIQKLDDTDKTTVQVALDTLVTICKAVAPELDQHQYGIQPLQHMLPKFVQFYSNSDPYLQAQAIHATSQFVKIKSPLFGTQLSTILKALYENTSSTKCPKVRKEFARIITAILEMFPEIFEPYIDTTIQYMINILKDANNDEEMKMIACNFWQIYAQSNRFKGELVPYLQDLITHLLPMMVYSDLELVDLRCVYHTRAEYSPKTQKSSTLLAVTKPLQDDTLPISDNNFTCPSTVHTPFSIDKEEWSDSEDDDSNTLDDMDMYDNEFVHEDFFSEDSPRKSSALTLEVLSTSIGDKMAPIILKHLFDHVLENKNWLVRESGILALGAVAEGGMTIPNKELQNLIRYLLTSLEHPKSLVRFMSCWTVGRFSDWLVQQHDLNRESRTHYFEPVMFELLKRMLDPSKRVQKFACSAFIAFTESASCRLVPYLQHILIQVNEAFRVYHCRKNILLLYDVVGTLADAVKSELNKPQYIYLLLPPLIKKWNEIPDKDTDLFPLLSSLSNVTAALGPGFIQYVEPVLTRCVHLIKSTLEEQILADESENHQPPDVEFLISALNLLSGIVRGLGPKIEPLIAQTEPSLIALLGKCIHDPVSEVVKSACALIGDIAIASFKSLEPYLHYFFTGLNSILHNQDYTMSVTAYNNILWCIGEMVIRYGKQSQPYAFYFMQTFIPLLCKPYLSPAIHENAMIALGRLCLACPEAVAPHLGTFLHVWLNESLSVRDHDEKESAFRGLCAVLKLNKQAAQQDLDLLLFAIASFRTPSVDLLNNFRQIINYYYSLTNQKVWDTICSELDEESKKRISSLLVL